MSPCGNIYRIWKKRGPRDWAQRRVAFANNTHIESPRQHHVLTPKEIKDRKADKNTSYMAFTLSTISIILRVLLMIYFVFYFMFNMFYLRLLINNKWLFLRPAYLSFPFLIKCSVKNYLLNNFTLIPKNNLNILNEFSLQIVKKCFI